MKKLVLFFIFSVCFIGLTAQDVKEKVPSTYDRSSLTVLFVDFGSESHWQTAKSKIDSLVFSDKYDNNNIDFMLIKPSFSRAEGGLKMSEAMLNELKSANVGRKIIAKWYNRQPDGTMDMELVHHRGRFTATDGDFLRAQTSKRGNAALEEFGNRLINLSYILVVDISNIKTMAEAGYKGQKGWQATASGYLYKMEFSEKTRDAFYDTWVYDDDTPEVKVQKNRLFNELEFPIVAVTQKSLSISASQSEADKGTSLFVKQKSTDQLMQELVQKSYDETIYRIEMEVEDFKVKTTLFATRPLRAKIGLKEGLKTDNRFFAYEYVYNSKTGKAEPVRRGVIRAESKSKITDNRKVATGDMGTSKFYQVAGRKLEAGFTLQQQNDFGIEVTLGPEMGSVGGFYGRADFRTGRFVGIKALYVYGEGGIDSDEYLGETYGMLRYGAGLAKGLQLMRNMELRPYAGVGIESTSYNDEDVSSLYARAGLNLALNLSHRFQILGGVGLYQFIGEATDSDSNSLGWTWDDYFQRSGSSILIGVKLGF
ncbi:MAG: hypothetical protein RBT74_00705 [Tenuifilaceae bacterium]|jgi:hypothetical protein|nr:hypothetical protein [Tenuifilaceae bacterium]